MFREKEMMISMRKEVAGLTSFAVVAVLLFASAPAVHSASDEFEFFITPPTQRIVSMGSAEDFGIEVHNIGGSADSYEFDFRSSPSSGAEENWLVEMDNRSLRDVEPGESAKTIITVKVPKNVNEYSQNVVEVVCTNSSGVKRTKTLYVGAEPPSEYNESYILTGLVVVIAGIVVVILRSIGAL